MPTVAPGPELSWLSKLRVLPLNRSRPCVGVRSSEREDCHGGIDYNDRASSRVPAVLGRVH